MILLEIFKSRHTRLEKIVTSQEIYRVGRHSSNDLVIADIAVPLFWFELRRSSETTWALFGLDTEKECQTFLEIKSEGHILKATNLTWLDGVATSQALLKEPLSALPMWVAFNFLWILYMLVMTWQKSDWTESVGLLFALNFSVVACVSLAAILSQVINKEYRAKQLFRVIVMGTCVMTGIGLNFLGLQWLLGTWARSELLLSLIYLCVGGYFLFALAHVIFDQISKYVRMGLISACMALVFFFAYKDHLPSRESFQFLATERAPLLYPLFEKSKIPLETFQSQLDASLASQSLYGEQLKSLLLK